MVRSCTERVWTYVWETLYCAETLGDCHQCARIRVLGWQVERAAAILVKQLRSAKGRAPNQHSWPPAAFAHHRDYSDTAW
jgi:hypothetical protein